MATLNAQTGQAAGAAANRAARTAADNEPEVDVDGSTAPCQLTFSGQTVGIPLGSNGYEAANRLVEHERAYRPGAKLDSTGSKADRWTLEATFENSIEEPGLDVINQGLPLYPDVMQRVIDIAKEGAIGEMIHPIDGKKRVRVLQVSRRIDGGEWRDSGHLTIQLVEDNEDRVDASSFSPAVRGTVRKLADKAIRGAMQEGVWHEDLLTFREFCNELEGLVRTPGEFADAIRANVRGALRAATSVIRSVRDETERFTDPDRQPVVGIYYDLKNAADNVSFALSGKNLFAENDTRNRLVRYVVTSVTTVSAIAAHVGQSYDAIIDANPQRIEDPLRVEPGVYRVWAHWP